MGLHPSIPLCMKTLYTFCSFFSLLGAGFAQDFPPGWIIPLELGQGFVKPKGGNELYLVALQVSPQYTLVEGSLRAGATAGVFYNSSKLQALAGPRVSVKLFTGPKILTATSFNINLLGEFLWGTKSQQLLGGGIGFETSNLFSLSLKVHSDLNLKTTWFQTGLSINLHRRKIEDL